MESWGVRFTWLDFNYREFRETGPWSLKGEARLEMTLFLLQDREYGY